MGVRGGEKGIGVMTDRRFFVGVEDWSSDQIIVRGEQAHHLKNVLRARAGETFEFIDGEGRWARAMVKAIPARGEVTCQIQEQHTNRSPEEDRAVLIQALIRFEKFEWILEKATELGATKIVPVVTARTEAKWREVSPARRDRWQKILIESLKQCRRLHLPVLTKPEPYDEAVSRAKAEVKLILSERPGTPALKSVFRTIRGTLGGVMENPVSPRISLAIGPEGGWDEEEIVLSRQCGFMPASLGEGVLRTETAALAGLAILGYESED